VSTPDVRYLFESVFDRRVTGLRRAQSPYSSSFSLQEIEVTFDNRETITTIFKDLSPGAMLEGARQARPAFLYTPEREIQVYRSLLEPLNSGTAGIYAAIVDPALRRYWLFLEKVSGLRLCDVGEFELWLEAARWLARFHASVDRNTARNSVPCLLQCDAPFYSNWLYRAHEMAGAPLDRIAERYDRVIEVLLSLPRTVLHNEFYASNVLIQQRVRRVRVCPVDWEVAAIGPSLFDVAALASGKWARDARLRILEAYHSTLPRHLQAPDMILAFDACQLHLALQWIGWSRTWSPPRGHAQNWLAEAICIAARESMAAIFA